MKKYWLQLIVLFLIVFLLNQFDISEYLGSLDSLNISTWLILLALQGLSFSFSWPSGSESAIYLGERLGLER